MKGRGGEVMKEVKHSRCSPFTLLKIQYSYLQFGAPQWSNNFMYERKTHHVVLICRLVFILCFV